MILVLDASLDDLIVGENTSEVRRVEAEEVAMHREFLDLAIFFHNDMDCTLGAGKRRKSERNHGWPTVFSAETKPFIDGFAWAFVVKR